MSQRLIELRRQFTLYNTVESIRAQLSKESTLLKSVYENITKVQNSKLNQDKLSQSLSEWQQTASENLIRAESKVDGAQEQLKKIGDRLAALQDYERKYYKLVRDFHTAITSASASS
jgi:DNA repair ATPase RecN